MRIKSYERLFALLLIPSLLTSCYTKNYCTLTQEFPARSSLHNSLDEAVVVSIYAKHSSSADSVKLSQHALHVMNDYDISTCDSVVVSLLNSGGEVRLFGYTQNKEPELSYVATVINGIRFVDVTIDTSLKELLQTNQNF